jgi:TRAP-type C4-dicarboxylate transport system permease small subunit
MGSSAPSRIIGSISRYLAFAGGIAMVAMMLHIVTDVAMKYFLNDPIDGTTEIVAAYYMVATVFLPLAYVAATEGHLIVELFTSRLSARPLKYLTVATGFVTLAYLAFLVYYTYEEAVDKTSSGEAWETSVNLVAVWPSRWLLPVGLAAMGLVILAQTIRTLREGLQDSEAESPPDESAGNETTGPSQP